MRLVRAPGSSSTILSSVESSLSAARLLNDLLHWLGVQEYVPFLNKQFTSPATAPGPFKILSFLQDSLAAARFHSVPIADVCKLGNSC